LQQRFPEEEALYRHNLPLQILFQLVTDQGTKQNGSADEIRQQLRQGKIFAPLALIEAGVEAFAAPDSRILNRLSFAKLPGERYEIMHDRLAEQIYNKFSGEELRRREAITTIRNKYKRFQGAETPKVQRQEYLSIGEIELIDQSLHFDALREEEKDLAGFFEASRKHHRTKKRRAALGLAVSIMAAVVFFAVAVFAVQANSRAIKERNSAIANELASRSFLELKNNNNATLALELATRALEADSTSVSALKALFSAFYQDPDGVRNPFYRELDQPALPIRHSRFTPSGSYVVTQSDSMVQVWNRLGKLVQSLQNDGSRVMAMDISFDDRFIAVVYEDQTCLVYDWKESAGEPFFEINQGAFVDLIFHPAVHEIILISTNEIFRADIFNKEVERIAVHAEEMFDVIYHPHGDQIITVQTGPSISLWNAADWNQIQTIPLVGTRQVEIDFSPNGDFIVTTRTPIAQVRDKSGALKQELIHRKREGINSARFSPSGRYVVTTGIRAAKLHDLEMDSERELSGHTGRVYGASFTSKEDHFLTYSEDGRIKVWNYSGEQVYELVGKTDHKVSEGMFSKNGDEIIMQIAGSSTRLFNLDVPQIELIGHSLGVTDVVIIPGKDIIITSGYDGKIIFWSKEGAFQSSIFVDDEEGISQLCLSRDGKTLVAASGSGRIYFWDVSDVQHPERWQLLNTHDTIVNDIAFSKSERYFVSIGRDGKTAVHPIDLAAKAISSAIPIPADSVEVSAFAFSKDEQTLIVGNGLGLIKIWELKAGVDGKVFTLVREIEAATDRINAIAPEADNDTFWAGSADGTLKAGDHMGNLSTPIQHNYGIGKPIVTHLDYVIAPGYLGHLIIADLDSEITNFVSTDEEEILDWAFNKERNLLITAAGKSAKIWLFDEVNVHLDLLAELKGHTAEILAIAISDQSDYLVTVSHDQKVVVWPIAPASLLGSRDLKE
jgi:WD40 repeat protein